MATLLKTPPLKAPPLGWRPTPISLKSPKPFCVSFRHRIHSTGIPRRSSLRLDSAPSLRFVKLVSLAANGGETETAESKEQVQEIEIEDSSDGAVAVEDGAGDENSDVEEIYTSAVLALLQSYKEALVSNNEAKVAEFESFLQSIEDEKVDLEKKVVSLSEELATEKDRTLRISADFDNFRKRTERERLSLVKNAQGEVLENLLSVLDNFERAKDQIKVATEGEEKINNSYQSIYKQFIEILGSHGVVPVETVGQPFDPMLHEAIMREDSTDYEEGIILQEFRKGFKLGERLLRPAMVKVSAGPGPAKPAEVELSEGANTSEATQDSETTNSSEKSNVDEESS
ncbi:hypothetical protein SLE2022_055940 [Rubroshorea leprosula]